MRFADLWFLWSRFRVGRCGFLAASGSLLIPLLGLACARAQPARTLNTRDTVNVAVLGSLSEAATYIGIDRGYFAQEGIDVQLVQFKNAPAVVPAMVTGQVDVGTGAPTAALFNALASGIPLTIVASNARLEPGRDGGALVLRKDVASEIQTPADLRAMKLGIGTTGCNTGELMYGRVLGSSEFSVSDFDPVVIPGFSDVMLAALEAGKIDGAPMAEPWLSLGVSRGSVVVWKRFAELAPSMENSLLVYSTGFATQRTDVARRFMVARLKAVRDYEDAFFAGRDRSTIVSILTKYTSITDPGIYEQMSFGEMDPDGRVNAASLEQLQDWCLAQGYLTKRADLHVALDPNFADYAVSVLGGYQSN